MLNDRALPACERPRSFILPGTFPPDPQTATPIRQGRIPRMQPYNLIVIGSGPGGQRAVIQGAKAGKRTGVIEKQTAIGGACINTGTIPSKTMREAVLHLSGFYDKNFYGTNHNTEGEVTMADLNFRVQHVVENEVEVVQDQLKRNGVELIHGIGKFADAKHIRVESGNGSGEFEAKFFEIARGTKPPHNPKG